MTTVYAIHHKGDVVSVTLDKAIADAIKNHYYHDDEDIYVRAMDAITSVPAKIEWHTHRVTLNADGREVSSLRSIELWWPWEVNHPDKVEWFTSPLDDGQIMVGAGGRPCPTLAEALGKALEVARQIQEDRKSGAYVPKKYSEEFKAGSMPVTDACTPSTTT